MNPNEVYVIFMVEFVKYLEVIFGLDGVLMFK